MVNIEMNRYNYLKKVECRKRAPGHSWCIPSDDVFGRDVDL